MSKIQKVITSWKGMLDADFPVEVKKSIIAITTNSATFPDLPVAISVMETLYVEYIDILSAGTSADLARKRKEIQEKITLNGNYINGVAQGNVSILELTAYPISKIPSKQGILEKTVLMLIKG